MTGRLYHGDSYLRRFDARAIEVVGDRVYLDRTAFYPTSGGQPHDLGQIGDAAVVDVFEEDGGRIAHVVSGTLSAGECYACEIDWPRRFDFMQQHSGQHLLSAVLARMFSWPTIGVHFGPETSTIDLELKEVDPGRLSQAEQRANEIVFENRDLAVSYCDSKEVADPRRPAGREGVLRVVSIADLDRSACGGTHVRRTGETGMILLGKLDKVRGNVRVEFVCGGRTLRYVRRGLEAAAAVASEQQQKLAVSEKSRRRLAVDLARMRGRELASGGEALHVRRIENGGIEEDLRAEAQSFTESGGKAFLAFSLETGAILLAVCPGSPVNAGSALKPLVEARGGRGGGSAQLAQGSVPPPVVQEAALEISGLFR